MTYVSNCNMINSFAQMPDVEMAFLIGGKLFIYFLEVNICKAEFFVKPCAQNISGQTERTGITLRIRSIHVDAASRRALVFRALTGGIAASHCPLVRVINPRGRVHG